MKDRSTQQSLMVLPAPAITFWAWIVFLVVLAAELVGAYIIVYKHGYVMNDALSRTANAYYVLFILPSKLASVGFVWNPLPSLLQLPILAFADWWRPLATSGFAGCIVTALFAGINASCLFRYFRYRGTRSWVALLIVFLYAFNPFIFFYGLNGMSETIFFTVIIVGIHNFVMWMEDRRSGRLLMVALMLAMGFLTRYEALTLILGFACSLLVIIYFMPDYQSPFLKKPASMKFHYTLATFNVTFLPVVYAIVIWMIVCWAIMDDPFYFLNSAYSNESQAAAGLSSDIRATLQDPAGAFKYMLTELLPFALPTVVFIIERILTGRIFKKDMLVFILLIGCFIGFHYVLLLTGRSFAWLRFFSYILPACLAFYPYELLNLRKIARVLTTMALCLSLLISAGLIPHYFSNQALAKEEWMTFNGAAATGLPSQLEMGRLINEKYSHNKILVDSFMTSALVLRLDHNENVTTTTSDNFMQCVRDPRGNGIEYIVAVAPKGVGLLDAINLQYPDLFYYGVPYWAELVQGDDFIRLYRVLPESEKSKGGEAPTK